MKLFQLLIQENVNLPVYPLGKAKIIVFNLNFIEF